MYPCVVFSPAVMNMLYLSPSLRRDFLDDTIISCSLEYVNLLKDYKKVLKTRNSLLKAINEKKAKESEIVFWDEKFALLSAKIYHFRFQFIEFLEKSIGNIKECFVGKIENIKLEYITKIDKQDIENSIKTYLQKNLERDIILQKTQI
jgi:DNA replication and repair protein RecF